MRNKKIKLLGFSYEINYISNIVDIYKRVKVCIFGICIFNKYYRLEAEKQCEPGVDWFFD